MSRRATPALLVTLAFLVAAGHLAAQDAPAREAPSREGESRFHLETNAGLSVSYFAYSVVAEPNLMFRPRRLGIGLGAKLLVGASQFDFLVAPFGRIELGWFYLNGGWAFEIVDAPGRYQMVEDGLLAAVGIAPDLLPIGYGRLGFDLGLETNVKLPGGVDSQLIAAYPLVASWRLPPLVTFGLLYAVATTSVRAGILYTFPL